MATKENRHGVQVMDEDDSQGSSDLQGPVGPDETLGPRIGLKRTRFLQIAASGLIMKDRLARCWPVYIKTVCPEHTVQLVSLRTGNGLVALVWECLM